MAKIFYVRERSGDYAQMNFFKTEKEALTYGISQWSGFDMYGDPDDEGDSYDEDNDAWFEGDSINTRSGILFFFEESSVYVEEFDEAGAREYVQDELGDNGAAIFFDGFKKGMYGYLGNGADGKHYKWDWDGMDINESKIQNTHKLKHVKLFEAFVNEAVSFGKKGIKAKLEDKLRLAKIAVEKWGDSYSGILNAVESTLKSGKLPSYKEPLMVQGDTAKDSYDIFQGRNAVKLAEAISKVIKKYKKYETEESSVPAAGGWSGTMRSTVGGQIQGRSNFNPGGRRTFLIAVTCGSGIDSKIKDKMFQEIYELMFVLDEYNSSDGGVMFDYSSGTNYSTIGLTNSSYSFNNGTANNLIDIMNNH